MFLPNEVSVEGSILKCKQNTSMLRAVVISGPCGSSLTKSLAGLQLGEDKTSKKQARKWTLRGSKKRGVAFSYISTEIR